MAFLVESGMGDADSNAYLSLDDFRTHHTDRGNTAHVSFLDTDVQAGIIRASDYIDKRFGRQFRGARKNKRQGLEWPRFNAFDNDGFLLSDIDAIPRQIVKACAEYALRALICQVLAPDPPPPVPKQDLTDSTGARPDQEATGQITRERDRIGPLETERWYETNSQVLGRNLGAGATGVKSSLVNDFLIPEYPEADLWIEELLKSSSSLQLVRGD